MDTNKLTADDTRKAYFAAKAIFSKESTIALREMQRFSLDYQRKHGDKTPAKISVNIAAIQTILTERA